MHHTHLAATPSPSASLLFLSASLLVFSTIGACSTAFSALISLCREQTRYVVVLCATYGVVGINTGEMDVAGASNGKLIDKGC